MKKLFFLIITSLILIIFDLQDRVVFMSGHYFKKAYTVDVIINPQVKKSIFIEFSICIPSAQYGKEGGRC